MLYLRAIFAVIIVLAVCACGAMHKAAAVSIRHGAATVTTDDTTHTTTVRTKDGTFTTGKGAVDLASLAVPIYPGATGLDGGSYTMSGRQGDAQVISLTSGDDFARVYAWYKARMPDGSEKMKIASGSTRMAEFATGEKTKDQRTVMIQAQQDRTSILISHNVKK